MEFLHYAFSLLKQFNSINSEKTSTGLFVPNDFQKVLQKMALWENLGEVFEVGEEHGFCETTVANILILHGAYFRLLSDSNVSRAQLRFVDSLYHKTFPSLNYNVIGKDILAPWVTLGAQEALLDMPLHEMSVIEYGSGISTFFFLNEASECVSFEGDNDPAAPGRWSKQMIDLAEREKVDLRLIIPNGENDCPVESLKLISKSSKVLVSIDGGDRYRHFDEWSKYLAADKSQNFVLMIDNSEISDFRPYFDYLHSNGACIVHHYGFVYGQMMTKQCTSFVTFNPSLLVAKSPSPLTHDKRWGRLNMQS